MSRKCFFTVIACICLSLPSFAQTGGTVPKPALTVEGVVCSGIEQRMPVDSAEQFSPDVGKVFFWCKVTGATDTTAITHVWLYDGKEMATVELPVRSPAWRTWSSKNILPSWVGKWEVQVRDAEGNVLLGKSFAIGSEEKKTSEKPAVSADTTGTKKS